MRYHLREPTDIAEELYAAGVDLLGHITHPGLFRLVGVVTYDLVGRHQSQQVELFNTLSRQRRSELALDQLAQRFGDHVVQRAERLGNAARIRLSPTLDFLDE